MFLNLANHPVKGKPWGRLATTCSPNSGQRPHVDLELPRHRCFVSGIAFRPASSFFLATLGRSVLSHTLVLPCWEVEHKAKIQPGMGRMGGKKKMWRLGREGKNWQSPRFVCRRSVTVPLAHQTESPPHLHAKLDSRPGLLNTFVHRFIRVQIDSPEGQHSSRVFVCASCSEGCQSLQSIFFFFLGCGGNK